jgi:hypothetical protein
MCARFGESEFDEGHMILLQNKDAFFEEDAEKITDQLMNDLILDPS